MKLRTVPAVVCAVAVVVTATLGPAAAQSVDEAKREQQQTRQRREEVAAQLDALHATDAQLEASVATLDTRISDQEIAVTRAQIAVARADAEARRLTDAAAVAAKRLADRRQLAAERAVSAYMHPDSTSTLEVFLGAKTVDEAERRYALTRQVARTDQDVIGGLRAAEADVRDRQAAAEAAQRDATQRRTEADQLLAQLQADRQQQTQARDVLAARMTEFRSEADALAAQENRLTRLIAQREAAQRAAEAAARRRTAPAAPGAPSAPSTAVTGTRDPNAPALVWPVNGTVTSEFGTRWGRMHQGIDIAADMATPIKAAAAGTVFFAGEFSGYGNVVLIDHGRGFVTLYAHQSRLGVVQGQQVAQGAVIGYVGSTGHSTGPHLHFETRVDGAPQNPRLYLPAR